MRWTRAESRWRDALLDAVLPLGAGDRLPEHAWAAWARGASPLLLHGFRLAVWWLTWAPLLRHRRPLHRLPPDARDAFLQRAAARRSPAWRQVLLVVKVVAATAAFARPDHG